MNTEYLGDALDYWKGTVLGGLQRQGCLYNLVVDAMPTDEWEEAHWRIYARLLQVKHEQVMIHQTYDWKKGESYFEEFNELKERFNGCDVFLDPDTGIYTGNRSGGPQHVDPRVIETLLNGSNVVLVYQHGAWQKMYERIDKVVKCVRQSGDNVECLSYQASQTAMLFFSRSSSRLDGIKAYFYSLLECYASHRVVRHHLQAS